MLRDDGSADFFALRSRSARTEARLIVFDLLEVDGAGHAPLAAGGAPRAPCGASSASISRRGCCSARSSRATRARVLFRHACERNLEGIVSKRKGSPYISGPTTSWRKVKCPNYVRAGEEEGT